MLSGVIIVAMTLIMYEGYKLKRKIKKENEQTLKEAQAADNEKLFNELGEYYVANFPLSYKKEVGDKAISDLKHIAAQKTGVVKTNADTAIEIIEKYRKLNLIGDFDIERYAKVAKEFN